MVIYSINDIEKLSGVKAHTIRIWEKRHGIINPKRTEKNIRYFDDSDLKLILNIAILNRNGIKISHIAKLSHEEIFQKVTDISEVDSIFEDELDALTLAVLELSETKFVRILDKKIELRGFEDTMDAVIYPLLDKLSTMWIAGSIKGAHEHFVSNLIRRKTISAIDQLPVKYKGGEPKGLIFLPKNEHHELSLLFLHFILKKLGHRTISLGYDIPLVDVIDAYKIYKPDYVFTIINDTYSEEPIQSFVNIICDEMIDSKVILSGYQVVKQTFDIPNNCVILKGLGEVKSMFSKINISISQ